MNCSIEGCNRPAHGYSFCHMHYRRWRKHGNAEYQRPIYDVCIVEGCSNKTRSNASPYCEKHYYRLRRNGVVNLEVDVIKQDNCIVCRKPLTEKQLKYCSQRCTTRNYRRQAHTKKCSICGNEFVPENYRIEICSDECAHERQKIQARAYHKLQMKINPVYRAKVFAHYIKRKIKRAEAVEFVVYDKVYKRDNYTCQLCNEPIDMSLPWPNPMSPSIDHIIPLSKDGEHSYENCQASHLRCNLVKSDS